MPKGYTSIARLQEFLDRQLTPSQAGAATRLMGAVEEWIDHRTDRRYWTAAGNPPAQTVTGEAYVPDGALVYLRSRPVLSIQSVTSRPVGVGTVATALVAGVDYELTDGDSGLVTVTGAHAQHILTFAYTIGGSMPDCVRVAATLLLAHWLRPALDADSFGNVSYRIGTEVSAVAAPHDIPPEVYQELAPVMRKMVFA